MSHTVQHEKSDWEAISPHLRTRWQRIAAATHGYLTPGNLVTIIGVLLSLAGLGIIYRNHLIWGLVVLGVGRTADILDGFVADQTKTKSHVGEAFDAGFDKVIAVVAIAVFLDKDIVPLVPLLVVLVESACNVLCSAVAKVRHRIIHPSKSGKYAAFLQWMCLLLFVIAAAIKLHSTTGADICAAVAYIIFVMYVGLGVNSAAGYARNAFGHDTQQVGEK